MWAGCSGDPDQSGRVVLIVATGCSGDVLIVATGCSGDVPIADRTIATAGTPPLQARPDQRRLVRGTFRHIKDDVCATRESHVTQYLLCRKANNAKAFLAKLNAFSAISPLMARGAMCRNLFRRSAMLCQFS